MPMRPAFVAMSRIVNARMPTQTCAHNRSGSVNPVTIPATGSAFHEVASCVV